MINCQVGAGHSQKFNKLFNDSVHGHIELPPLCVKIIDTPIFQRLRQVKQLGFTYRVYPGASHNRFEHSLGVCYLAGEIVDSLNKNCPNDIKITEKEKLCLQIAGLCHDLGHGPFSHVWRKFKTRVTGGEWKHEIMSLKLFDEILKIQDIADTFQRELDVNSKTIIRNMILGNKPAEEQRAFLYEIISNEKTGIDIDKWDYLLRDAKHLNINITFDPHRLMKCQRIMKAQDNVYHICYRDKAKMEIIQMMVTRAELHRRAYQHQVVKMIEEMWIDALHQLNEDGYKFHGKLLSQVDEDPNEYIRLTDELFDILYYEKKGTAVGYLLDRIKRRKLYRIENKAVMDNIREYEEIERDLKNQRELGNSDLYITKVKLEMKTLEELSSEIILYDKSGQVKVTENAEDEWKSVPTFLSSQNGSFKYIEAILFSKVGTSPKDAAAEALNKHNGRKRRANDEC